VYRLEGVGRNGAAVIAKRCKPADAVIERTVYEEVLPHLPLTAAGYHGWVPDLRDEFTWLFTDDVQGEEYSYLMPQHRVYAGRWLGLLHAGAQAIGARPGLPEAGPSRAREHLRRARELIRTHLDNPMLAGDDVASLETLLARFDELEDHWDRLEEACAGMQPTMVHGDFNGKNLRVRASGPDPGIAVFDWEDAGWGVPATDLAQLALPSSRLAAGPDIDTYWGIVRDRWPEQDRADLERVANCGTVFRALAALEWDSRNLGYEWAPWFVDTMRLYEAELAHALDRLDWRRRAPPRHEVVGT
jgi:hypothetical protein